jgi:hypothetical protein
MYKLTLARSERAAIDWVGHRDWNGDELYRLLWGQSDVSPADVDWDTDCDATFSIPESVAWQIRELYEHHGSGIPCFADDLRGKIQTLLDSIV